MLSHLETLCRGLKLANSLLMVIVPSINVPKFQELISGKTHDDDLTSDIATEILKILLKVDSDLIDAFESFSQFQSVVDLAKKSQLDPFTLQLSYDEVERFQNILRQTLGYPVTDTVSSICTSRTSPDFARVHKNIREQGHSDELPKKQLKDIKLELGSLELSDKNTLLSTSLEMLMTLESFIRMLLGLSRHDCDAFCRKAEKVVKGKKKAKPIERLSSSVLQFITNGREQLKCLVGSGVPRCLRMYFFIQQLVESIDSCETSELDCQIHSTKPLHFSKKEGAIYSLAMGVITIGLGILADDLKSAEGRLSSIDGFQILMTLPQFNSSVLLLGLQKPTIIDPPVSRQTYITQKGKRKKLPGFRSSAGNETMDPSQPTAIEEAKWLNVNDLKLLFDFCPYCKLQYRRTFHQTPEHRRVQISASCLGCRRPLKSAKDLSTTYPPVDLVFQPDTAIVTVSPSCGWENVSNSSSDESGELCGTSKAKGNVASENPNESSRSPGSTLSVLNIENSASTYCSWIRPSLFNCVTHTLDNIQNKETVLQQMIKEHLTINLLDLVIRSTSDPSESFKITPCKEQDVLQLSKSTTETVTLRCGTISGLVPVSPIIDTVPWGLPRHGWILRLLDDLEDDRIRCSILNLLGQLFLLRPTEELTRIVRFASHLSIIAATSDQSSEVTQSALEAIMRSSRLVPLRDGAVKKLIRLMEVEDFALRFRILCDILCRCCFSDSKAIKFLCRGIMIGNTKIRSQFQNEWPFAYKSNGCIAMTAGEAPAIRQLDSFPCTLDNTKFYLQWNNFSISTSTMLWITLSARCCFIIGLTHSHLLDSVLATLPLCPNMRDEEKSTESSKESALSDVFMDVLGIVAFLLGAGLKSWEAGRIVRGWHVDLRNEENIENTRHLTLRLPIKGSSIDLGLETS